MQRPPGLALKCMSMGLRTRRYVIESDCADREQSHCCLGSARSDGYWRSSRCSSEDVQPSTEKHGIDDDDAAYYGDNLRSGGVLVTVSDENIDRLQAQEVLYAHGGHSSSRMRTAGM